MFFQASQKEESYSEQMRVLIAKHKEVRTQTNLKQFYVGPDAADLKKISDICHLLNFGGCVATANGKCNFQNSCAQRLRLTIFNIHL